MQHLVIPLLAFAVSVLSTVPAYADLGDQLAKLLPIGGATGDNFGQAVAISSNTAIVGANQDDENGVNSGSAFLFDVSEPASPVQLFMLLADEGSAGDAFGWAVAIQGNTSIVGAIHDDDNGSNSGSAYIFDTTTGQQLARLLPDDGEAGELFGYCVAISGNIAIVGAISDDDNGSESGSAYIFDISDPENPAQIAKLLASDGVAGDAFGLSLAINSTLAIVGAPCRDDNGINSGSAYVFNISDPEHPLQIAKLLPKDGAADDYFAWAVALSGENAFIGAYHDDDNGLNSGSAYIFDTNTGQQITKFMSDDGAAGDDFAWSIAISGTTAIFGAPHDDAEVFNTGSAYLFDISDIENPVQIAKLIAKDGAQTDNLGVSVAISGDIAIAGAYRDDDNGTNSGSAYIYDAAVVSMCPWDLDNSGSVGTGDLLELFSQWGTAGPADFDYSGVVDTADLLILFANWGPCP